MPLVSIADGSLFAERLGDGPPRVLALHGWGRRGSDFAHAFEGLDVLALDLPGFGASPPPPAPLGAAGYAALIEPVFAMFSGPPVMVGHSFGGRVAVSRQAHHPRSASGLVLVASPLVRRAQTSRRPSLRFRLARTANRLGLIGGDRMERLRRRQGSADYRAATGVMRDVLVTVVNETYEQELSRIDVPVHLLWGSDDREVPVTVAEEAAGILPGDPEVEILDGVGHHVPLAAPQALRRAVTTMLERVDGAG